MLLFPIFYADQRNLQIVLQTPKTIQTESFTLNYKILFRDFAYLIHSFWGLGSEIFNSLVDRNFDIIGSITKADLGTVFSIVSHIDIDIPFFKSVE